MRFRWNHKFQQTLHKKYIPWAYRILDAVALLVWHSGIVYSIRSFILFYEYIFLFIAKNVYEGIIMVWDEKMVFNNPDKKIVGENLYVFSYNGGMQNSSSCVIDAHGGQYFMGNSRHVRFKVPEDMTVNFYVEHNQSLLYSNHRQEVEWDPSPADYNVSTDLRDIMIRNKANYTQGKLVVAQSYKEGEPCPNYHLSKVQQHKSAGCFSDAWSNYLGGRNNMSYEDVINFMVHKAKEDDRLWMKDIVTIRERPFKKNISLKGVIDALIIAGYFYNTVDCLICRSPMFFGSLAAKIPTRR